MGSDVVGSGGKGREGNRKRHYTHTHTHTNPGLTRPILQDKSTAEERGSEDNGTSDQRSKAKVHGADRRSSALLGGAGAAGAYTTSGDGTVTSVGNVGLGRTGLLGTVTGETRALAGTVLEVVRGTGRNGRKLVGLEGDVPGAGLRGALRRRAGGAVAAVALGRGGAGVGALEGLEVGELLDLAVVNLDKAVV